MIRNATGQVVGVKPVAEPDGFSSPDLEQLVSQNTAEDIQMNTLGLMKKVALNPAVTLGYSYVTSTVDPVGKKFLFVGDLADWINYCVGYTLQYGFGVKFGIITGGPSMKDIMYQSLRGDN